MEGNGESSGSLTATENTENTSYLFSPTLRKVLMSSFMSPVETHAAMKAALFLFLFIRLSSFRPDIHYSFYLLRGRRRHCNFSSLQMLSLLWFKSVSKLVLIQISISVLCCTVQNITLRYIEDIIYSLHFMALVQYSSRSISEV